MSTLSKKNKNLSVEELARIESRITYSTDGHWLMGGYQDKDGYCQVVFRRKVRRAHRVVWYAVHGIIGDQLYLDHKCRVRNCVNPSHLRVVTPRENTIQNSKSLQALNALKTTCKKGHPFDRRYPIRRGSDKYQRYCSICQAQKTKRLRAEWKKQPLLDGV